VPEPEAHIEWAECSRSVFKIYLKELFFWQPASITDMHTYIHTINRNCRNSDFEKTAVTRLGKSQQVALI